jgi:hypothetical protein
MATKSEQIRTLNDRLRQHLSVNDGTAIITVGLQLSAMKQ